MDCVFCQIVDRTARASIVAECDLALAFMDLRQYYPGHVLVIPKVHTADVRALDRCTGAALMEMVSTVARAVSAEFPADGLSIWHSIGEAAGQEVMHLHFHVHPRLAGDGMFRVYPGSPEHPDRATLDRYAVRLQSRIGGVHHA